MQCPIDQSELKMADRQGVEIDYCPQCRGVWLDRGELDKLIERTQAAEAPRAAAYDEPAYPAYGEHDRGKHGGSGGKHGSFPSGKRRRGGFLGDLFDF